MKIGRCPSPYAKYIFTILCIGEQWIRRGESRMKDTVRLKLIPFSSSSSSFHFQKCICDRFNLPFQSPVHTHTHNIQQKTINWILKISSFEGRRQMMGCTQLCSVYSQTFHLSACHCHHRCRSCRRNTERELFPHQMNVSSFPCWVRWGTPGEGRASEMIWKGKKCENISSFVFWFYTFSLFFGKS